MSNQKRPTSKIRLIGQGVPQTLNYLLEDQDDLESVYLIARRKDGDLVFCSTGDDIKDLGVLRYLEARIVRAHFGDDSPGE